MNYLRLDKVVKHLEHHASGNTYYKGLLRQYELLGRLTERQIVSVERAIAQDNKRAQEQGIHAVREWNSTH
jgi:hypothetical protein